MRSVSATRGAGASTTSPATSGSATSGQGDWEEIDIVERAGNYGWNIREGAHCFEPASGCQTQDLIDPVAEYGHDLGFSITGGHVYRGLQTTQVAGNYVFADFGGMIAWLEPDGAAGFSVEQLAEQGCAPPGAPGVAADFLVRRRPRRGAVPARLRPGPDPASSCSRTEERANPALYSVGGSAGGVGMGFRALGLTGLAVVLLGCGDGDTRSPLTTLLPGLDERPSNTTCVAPERIEASTRVETPRAFPGLTFPSPVALRQAPGDPSRWFAVELGGRIRVFDDNPGVAATRDFIDLSGKVHGAGEAGLLGFAFHPDFATNGLAYVNYVGKFDGTIRSGHVRVCKPGWRPDARSRVRNASCCRSGRIPRIVLAETSSSAPMDSCTSGSATAASAGENAQDPRSLLGKMLRIDVDARPGGAPYGIPGGATRNPFFGNPLCNADGTGTQDCPEIYAPGLQDPRRWSFDRRTGALWLGDAGQGSLGTISRIERGGRKPVAEYGRSLVSRSRAAVSIAARRRRGSSVATYSATSAA